ncbi:MarR family winged helix-turn-helix transcriptional regulator, partial [Streptomyces venezuelae]|uniref:MarR family winged helix-turn-helix transcriptional regulator n=1 Tax=Streptomyces venezuelae TaxID=54571 RepID=UPI001F4157DD
MATSRTDPLTLEVVELIGTVVARYYEEYEQAAAQHALTGAQARVLGLLSLDPLPMRHIAQKLKCEPSNITGIVDRLEARGLAERRPDPADRRVKLAAATEEGRETARRLRESLNFARDAPARPPGHRPPRLRPQRVRPPAQGRPQPHHGAARPRHG